MVEKVDGAAELLEGAATEMAMRLRTGWDKHKKRPVPDDGQALAKDAQITGQLSRAMSAVVAFEAAVQRALDAKRKRLARKTAALEEMGMDDFDGAELQRQAHALDAGIDQLLAGLDEDRCGRDSPDGSALARRRQRADAALASGGEQRAA